MNLTLPTCVHIPYRTAVCSGMALPVCVLSPFFCTRKCNIYYGLLVNSIYKDCGYQCAQRERNDDASLSLASSVVVCNKPIDASLQSFSNRSEFKLWAQMLQLIVARSFLELPIFLARVVDDSTLVELECIRNQLNHILDADLITFWHRQD